ncbi:MAG: T9SS type A sorting domain-containing protein, partial [Bacteroidetes bacterium]
VDTSYNIQWAMMPTNGSDITISNSTIRSIGLWFEGSDTSNVSGLVNNSNYSNFTAPLSDRNLQLNNTSLQTWSIYSFDSVFINISGCIVGEVGAFGHSKVNGTNYWVDGSGGYCFSSDTSSLFNGFCSVSSHVRSERNSIQMFAYSTQNNGMTSAIGSSVLIVVQSTLPQDPVPYEKSCVWMAIISQPSTAYVDSVVPVVGSAWIDKTNVSPWMDFGSSRVWYQKTGDTIWKTVNNAVVQEIRSSTLALWNTNGLTPGSYNLRLMLFDNWGDSVEAIKSVNLLPAILLSADEEPSSEIPISIYPNPASGEFDVQCLVFNVRNVELRIYDVFGKIIFQSNISSPTSHISCDLPDGIYFLQIQSKDFIQTKKITIIR